MPSVGELVTPTGVLVLEHGAPREVWLDVMMYCQYMGDGLNGTMEDEEVSDIRRLADALEDAIRGNGAIESRFPAQPPSGSVLRFEQELDRRVYTYVALRVADGWYLSGRQTVPIGWDELVEKIGSNICHLVTEYAEIPKPPADPIDEIDDPAEWFRSVYGSHDE